jgi:magnesium chelatase family protein
VTVARTLAVALIGIEGRVVEVEADITSGLPATTIVGLPDTVVSQARDRVKAAVVNSGAEWPRTKITVNLSPAALPKRGGSFDLALAVAVLTAAGALRAEAVADRVFIGELGLDGRVRGVPGVLPALLGAVEAGVDRVVVARANAAEAELVPGISVTAVASLRELLRLLRGEDPGPDASEEGPEVDIDDSASDPPPPPPDLSDVLGQAAARRAVEVAAAGGHHLYLHGPPGTGKTMLAERLPGLFPPLAPAESLEVTAIHSVAGLLRPGSPLVTTPPFRDIHHTATLPAVVGGGGNGMPRPGAVSLAHRGVLFMDEAPEFPSGVLEALRQPLESGVVVVSRANGTIRFPARFTLVLAANPCPCAAVSGRREHCSCSASARRRYQERLSGPLLDRIDLQVRVERLTKAEMLADRAYVECSALVAERVAVARERAAARFAGTPWRANGDVPCPVLKACWPLPREALHLLDLRFEQGLLTARSYDRVIRVAWTLADLAGKDRPGLDEISAAYGLRMRT